MAPVLIVEDCPCGCGSCAADCPCEATFDNMLIDELCPCNG